MTETNHVPKFIIENYSDVKIEKALLYIAQLYLYQFTKTINIFRVGTPNPFIFKT